MGPRAIETSRLRLVPATAALARLALEEHASWLNALAADIAPDWPPEHVDEGVLRFTCERLDAAPGDAGWWSWYVVLRGGGVRGTLIGTGGFKGPPTSDGVVEVGYAIVASQQRRGYATEAVAALMGWAWSHSVVRRIAGETLPELTASIRVMEKLGLKPAGAGAEAGVVRYERARV